MKKLMPAWLKHLLTAPTVTLSRWPYAVRYFLELCRHEQPAGLESTQTPRSPAHEARRGANRDGA